MQLKEQILKFSQSVGILYVKRGNRYGHATAFFVAPNIIQSTAHEIKSTDELIFVIHDRIGISFVEFGKNAWNANLIYMDPLIDFAFFELQGFNDTITKKFLLPSISFPIEGELCLSIIFNGSVDNEWLREMHRQLPTNVRKQTPQINEMEANKILKSDQRSVAIGEVAEYQEFRIRTKTSVAEGPSGSPCIYIFINEKGEYDEEEDFIQNKIKFHSWTLGSTNEYNAQRPVVRVEYYKAYQTYVRPLIEKYLSDIEKKELDHTFDSYFRYLVVYDVPVPEPYDSDPTFYEDFASISHHIKKIYYNEFEKIMFVEFDTFESAEENQKVILNKPFSGVKFNGVFFLDGKDPRDGKLVWKNK